MYKKEAMEYDADYVKKYDEDLNTTLIFVRRPTLLFVLAADPLTSQAGLFSAVSSAFVLDVQSKLQPDPNEQSAALLRAILLTLNQSAIPGESPTVPPIQENTPSGITTTSCLMYASLLVSLLAAFIAMLGKQWLNRYLRNTGGSMIERCGDRQRKLEGLERWPFHSFVESLPMMLQLALLLLACGLCRQTIYINTSVASVLITLTALGVLFYLSIVIAGASSYACPFQTPVSTALRNSWKEIRPRITPVVLPILRIILRLPLKLAFWRRFQRSHPPNPGEDIPTPWFSALYSRWWNLRWKIQSRICATFHHPLAITSTLRCRLCRPPLPTDSSIPEKFTPWLAPKDLAAFLRTNGSDVRCVSWILRNITDPEAVEAAVRLVGTIRWFEDQAAIEPPYDEIFSAFEGCFDSTKEVYPGLEDRAYYSLRAILWIHALANCRSREFARKFHLPIISKVTLGQGGLSHLLNACYKSTNGYYNSTNSHYNSINSRYSDLFETLYTTPRETNHIHMRSVSNLILHLAWAKQSDLQVPCIGYPDSAGGYGDWDTIPVDATLNYFLVWCILLDSPVEEEVLRIQDKSYAVSYFSLRVTHVIVH